MTPADLQTLADRSCAAEARYYASAASEPRKRMIAKAEADEIARQLEEAWVKWQRGECETRMGEGATMEGG